MYLSLEQKLRSLLALEERVVSQNEKLPQFYGLREDSDSRQLGVSAVCLDSPDHPYFHILVIHIFPL